ncbi:MAG: sulfatase-like hydrolase/transferase [Pseudomonadota bacterium]|nr:sulfatase-like hydrolase/transferase [Acidobacteriota bacterium]
MSVRKSLDKAVELLNEYKHKNRPFFLSVGFIRPHLPFVAPKKYFDLYPPESIPLADNQSVPDGAPDCAFPSHEEPRVYIDAQVGRLIGELDRLGMRENTVICLWGDHGWHLGENSVWGKMTNFEEAAHAPG